MGGKMISVGVVGYSNDKKFDHEIAKTLMAAAFKNVMASFDTEDIEIVSGWTSSGIPKIAYDMAKKYKFSTVGLSAKEAEEYETYDVDKVIIEGEKFGDESEKFIDYIDCLIRVGGGDQSMNETKMAKEKGLEVFEYDLLDLSKK
jgi:hypothetical protein